MMKSVVAAVLLLVVGNTFAYGVVHPPAIKIGGGVQPASGTVVTPKLR